MSCKCVAEYNNEDGAFPKWLEIWHITADRLTLECCVCNITMSWRRE